VGFSREGQSQPADRHGVGSGSNSLPVAGIKRVYEWDIGQNQIKTLNYIVLPQRSFASLS
jgi:hypothetical protein